MKANEVVLLTDRLAWADRLLDYVELTKPRIAGLVLATVAVGGWLAAGGSPDVTLCLHAVLGTALVATGSGALNQWAERRIDARMARTANRPLPAGRIAPVEAASAGALLCAAGLVYLGVTTGWLALLLAATSLLLYLAVYTPLKRITVLNTLVGAVAGALPPLIGWTAVSGRLDPESCTLFAIIFCWQFPHFGAIAWLYRHDYARAGLRMLPTSALGRRLIGWHILSYLLVLVPVSLRPAVVGMAGPLYFWGALFLGIGFVGCGLAFLLGRTDEHARLLLRASLVYLPALLGLLMLDAVGR